MVRTLASVLVAISLGVAATSASGSEQKQRPTLRASSLSPLVLRGVRFRPLERVRLIVTVSGETRQKAVRATRIGAFTASFPSIDVDRCLSGFGAVAVGRLSSRVILKLPQLLCPPRSP
jgi:hypothetical protein